MVDKAELIITALQQRIGEIVSNYETQIAVLRAELTTVINQAEKEKALNEYSDEIIQKISEATDV